MGYPVVLLFGPTAAGKTELIVKVFKNNYEIINADSMQVYKYMNIGTAKPSGEIRSLIPHHLIDIAEPSEQFNAGKFVKSADSLVPGIIKRGRIPVISGGTAFYLKTFMYGLPETPAGDPGIRKVLHDILCKSGVDYLYDRLKRVDPEIAGRINSRDHYRIIRALEVYRKTGKPLSSCAPGDKKRDLYRFLFIGLTRERTELYESINKRVDEMFEKGLKDEVSGLLEMGYNRNDPGMKGIGYREFLSMQQGCFTLQTVKEAIKRNSRRYAKRQMTFLRKWKTIKWFYPDETEHIYSSVAEFLNRKGY